MVTDDTQMALAVRFCFLLSPESVEATLRRAVATHGDSDSIACFAGAFVGAYNGLQGIPKDWVKRIEYKKELESLVNF